MKKNDIIKLEITAMSSEGSGIGRYEGMAVFVPQTAVGDTATVKILKVKPNLAFGKALEIIVPSNDRIHPDCDVFQGCGGCVYRHISYPAETLIKQKRVGDAIRRIGGVDMPPRPIVSGSPDGYRNKAQYPISENGEVGFFANHSHRIVNSDHCNLQPEVFSRICEIFTSWVRFCEHTVYNEQTGKGMLRHLYIRQATVTGEIMVCIVINSDRIKGVEALIESLRNELGESFKTLVLNINKKQTNVILSSDCRAVYGDGYIYDELCGVKVRINPLSFYQVNHDMAERLYKKAEELASPEGKTVLDLYCGAGTIGLSMAEKADKIIGVEIIPEAVEDAKFNAELGGFSNTEFICDDAAGAAQKLNKRGIKPDVVILDPPRKGCSAEVIDTVAKGFSPDRIVYVSCDPSTLARDVKIFTEKGYKLVEYTPFDLFPRTAHVETVCLLSKLHADQHIEVELNLDEMDLTTAESKATYDEIKEYVLENTGLKVSQLYIAQIKRRYGIIERVNYNLPKSDNAKVPNCPPDKEAAIVEALRHFGMIK